MANKTKAQIVSDFSAALDANISNSGTLTDAEIVTAQNTHIMNAYSINPDTKPTPKIKFIAP